MTIPTTVQTIESNKVDIKAQGKENLKVTVILIIVVSGKIAFILIFNVK